MPFLFWYNISPSSSPSSPPQSTWLKMCSPVAMGPIFFFFFAIARPEPRRRSGAGSSRFVEVKQQTTPRNHPIVDVFSFCLVRTERTVLSRSLSNCLFFFFFVVPFRSSFQQSIQDKIIMVCAWSASVNFENFCAYIELKCTKNQLLMSEKHSQLNLISCFR